MYLQVLELVEAVEDAVLEETELVPLQLQFQQTAQALERQATQPHQLVLRQVPAARVGHSLIG